MSLQSTTEEEDSLICARDRLGMQMQSSFDLPIGDTSSRELLQEDELIMATVRMMSVEEPDEVEEAIDNFEMETPNESRQDLDILSPIKLSMMSYQLLSTTAAGTLENNLQLASSLKGATGDGSDRGRVNEVVGQRRPRKVVEFANFDDCEQQGTKQKRTDSAGGGTDAAIQAKIFSEIKK